MILKPYITIILTSAVIAYVFYPLYNWIKKGIRNSTIAALISSIIVMIALIVPLLIILASVQKEAVVTYNWAKVQLQETGGNATTIAGSAKSIEGFIEKYQIDKYVNLGIVVTRVSNTIMTWVTDILLAIPRQIMGFFMTLFLVFYFFKDGVKVVDSLDRALSLKKSHMKDISRKMGELTNAVIYGSIILALIQGALGGIAFWALGLSSPLLWGLVMALCALLPYIGTAIVWFPASVYLIVAGLDTGTWYKGIILLLLGFIIISNIDNLLRPKIVGQRANVHPVVVLLGVIGGLAAFGFVGIVLGPLVLALALEIASIYSKSRG